MIGSRASTIAGALVAFAIALPAAAQGKSGQPHGKPAAPPPTTTTLPAAAAAPTAAPADSGPIAAGTMRVAPFSWMDDASLTAPGTVWVGVSTVSWHGGGVHQVVVPVFDGSIGLTPRLQLGASVPRAAGGVGTSFFSAKIGILTDDTSTLKLAITPTVEVLSSATMQAAAPGEARMHLGLPVSIQIDRGGSRIYGSSGYFSPGISVHRRWISSPGQGQARGVGLHQPRMDARDIRAAPRPAPASKRCLGRRLLRPHAEHCRVRIARTVLLRLPPRMEPERR